MPGLNSFIGELLIIKSAFATRGWLGAMAILGVALGTAYLVRLYYRVAMGEKHPVLGGLALELNSREAAILAPLAVLAVVLGVYPDGVLSYVRASVAELLAGVTR
jgi:NADH-quinone oxidoreductase subunit M